MKEKSEYFCILGGGGIRGCAYTGTLRALKELDLKITGWAGSSIGAVVAVLYTAGYNEKEIADSFKDITFDFFNDLNFSFGKDFALSKGGNFQDWIKDKIESKFYGDIYQKGKMEPVTFKKFDKNIVIFSVNIHNSTFHEFSKEKTPEVEIANAIRASVSMPGLYKPVTKEGACLVDGDLIKSVPLWAVSNTINKTNARILEFRLEDNETPKEINSTASYLNAVYNTLTGFATDYIIETYKNKDKFDYIKINLPDVSVIDFMMSESKKEEIAQIGYKTTIDYFKDFYPTKKQALFEAYYDLQLMLMKIGHEIETGRIKNSYLLLMELMAHLCEDKDNLDREVVKKITNFKNLFKENYKISKFFFIQGFTLNDEKVVLSSLKEIVEILKTKTANLK